jgi:[ribosomal protein S5]-alanine N-acetyltransferase
VTTIGLEIVPATTDHLRALVEGTDAFEREFGLTAVDGYCEFPEALPRSLEAIGDGDADPQWSSHLFVVPADDALVGFGGFKGPPADGVVEIGYGIAPAYRGKGLATEASRQMIERARAAGVSTVVAHTLAEPNASTRVLSNLGFEHTQTTDDPADGKIWRWERRLD